MLKVLPGWELDVDRGPDCLFVRIREPSDLPFPPPPLGEVLWSVLEQHFTYRLVVELDQLGELDDDTLEQLVLLRDRIARHGGLMRICGLSPHNRRLLQEHRPNDQFVVYQDRGEALLAATPRRPR